MALTDAKDLPGPRPFFRVPARLQAWLAGEHAPAQRTAGAAFAIRVISAAIVFLTQILLARWMGEHEFGIYVYAWTWLVLVGDIIHLGLPLTAQRFIPEYSQHRSFALLRGFLAGSRWVTFGAGVVAAALGCAAVRAFKPWLDPQAVMPLYLACVSLPLVALSVMCDGVARTYNWIGLALVPHTMLRPLVLLALMTGAHALGYTIDADATMTALVAAIAATTVLQFTILHRRLKATVEPGPRTYEFRAWFLTSLPIITVWGFYTLLCYTDVLVLQQFRPAAEVAHYYAASKTLLLVGFVHFSVAAVVAHRFSAYHIAGDRDGLVAFVANAVRWIFWPSLALVVVMLAIGKPMLWLFGPSFVEAYPVMFVLAIGLMARAAIGPGERLLNMLGEQRRCALVYAAAFAINLAGCFALAPRFGGMGVAMATSGAIVIESALLFAVAKRRLGLHLFIWRPRAVR